MYESLNITDFAILDFVCPLSIENVSMEACCWDKSKKTEALPSLGSSACELIFYIMYCQNGKRIFFHIQYNYLHFAPASLSLCL